MNGTYFWSSSIVLSEVINRGKIEQLIDHDNF